VGSSPSSGEAPGPARYEVVERRDDLVVLRLEGPLTESVQTERIGEALEEHYVDDGVRVIRVDIASVDFLDNYGVATLVGLYQQAHARGKRLFVERATGQARDKLRVTGVLGILEQG
jgi:anti-anti-sigma factor